MLVQGRTVVLGLDFAIGQKEREVVEVPSSWYSGLVVPFTRPVTIIDQGKNRDVVGSIRKSRFARVTAVVASRVECLKIVVRSGLDGYYHDGYN